LPPAFDLLLPGFFFGMGMGMGLGIGFFLLAIWGSLLLRDVGMVGLFSG
jgi:hypothetical protein